MYRTPVSSGQSSSAIPLNVGENKILVVVVGSTSTTYTISVNLAGLPGISIPCGMDESNLPIGLQILTPAFTEDNLLRIARMFEAGTDWHKGIPAMVR